MVKRFVAELPRKQILCAGSGLSPRVLRNSNSTTTQSRKNSLTAAIEGQATDVMLGLPYSSTVPLPR
jgi:hypothetical protein